MAKKKRGKFKPGTWVGQEIYVSRAFHALTGFAPQLLIMLLGKRDIREKNARYVCTNKDNITMTNAELENIYNQGKHERSEKKDGIKRPRISNAFKQLHAKGFMKTVYHGGICQQDKNRYALTDDWCLWRPGQVIYEKPKDTCQRGYRKPKKK